MTAAELPQPLRIADDFEERRIVIEDIARMTSRPVKDARRSFHQLSADWQTLNVEGETWKEDFPDGPFLGAWQEHRKIYGYTLRSELVYRLKRALEQNPEFSVEGPPEHLLVDEYQDLNACDLAVIDAIAQRGARLYVAGDDDQSIYNFRYAHPEGIRTFEQHHDGSVTKALTECKR